MSLSRDEILRLQHDDLVTITIRHAQVNWVDDNEINISVPGLDDTWGIPLTDFDGVPLYAHLVSVERAATCTGCSRVIPLSEAMAGLTTCEHCPAPSDVTRTDINSVSERAKAAVLAWLNMETRSFTDILRMAWCATVTETGGTPDEVELLDGSRLVYTCGTGWTVKPVDDLDLSTLGQDYIKDPAERIKAIAAEFPELVVRVDGGEQL